MLYHLRANMKGLLQGLCHGAADTRRLRGRVQSMWQTRQRRGEREKHAVSTSPAMLEIKPLLSRQHTLGITAFSHSHPQRNSRNILKHLSTRVPWEPGGQPMMGQNQGRIATHRRRHAHKCVISRTHTPSQTWMSDVLKGGTRIRWRRRTLCGRGG